MPIICKDFSMVELKAQNQVLTVLSKAENLATLKLPETSRISRSWYAPTLIFLALMGVRKFRLVAMHFGR